MNKHSRMMRESSIAVLGKDAWDAIKQWLQKYGHEFREESIQEDYHIVYASLAVVDRVASFCDGWKAAKGVKP